MTKETFELDGSEFIPLIGLLKVLGIAGTGGEAKHLVDEGLVQVNGEVELQRRKKIRAGDRVQLEDITIEISA